MSKTNKECDKHTKLLMISVIPRSKIKSKIYQKASVIYADTASLLEKIYASENNPENSFTTKVSTHTACGYSIFMWCAFDSKK